MDTMEKIQQNGHTDLNSEPIGKQKVTFDSGQHDIDEVVPLTSAYKGADVETRPRSRTENVISDGKPKQLRKRVSWISEEDKQVILNYLEPENPWSWKNVQMITAERLLRNYKQHCDMLGIRPLPSILIQIQKMKELKHRQELLNLRGDRLDQRHIEALEEVLKRVQFVTIDLEATHLDDEGVQSLFDMFEYYDSAERVNLGYNKNIGLRGWQSCGRLIKKTQSLTYLDIRHCVITEQGMPLLGRSLRLGSTLHILHLENCNITGRTLLILVAALKINELLKELFLADNKLMPSDGIQLGNLLKFNHKLQLLDIRNNHIQDVGLSHIMDGLKEQIKERGLNTLVLWNNQITHLGMPALCRTLPNLVYLETINLGHNNINNEGIHKLKEGLFVNRSLLRIGLQTAKISCEGAIALAEYIAECTKLLRLDIRENDIKTAGLMALSLALKVNQSVTRIDLDKETKKEVGVKEYAETQKHFAEEILKCLTRNRELAESRPVEAANKNPTKDQTQVNEEIVPESEHLTNGGSPQETLDSLAVENENDKHELIENQTDNKAIETDNSKSEGMISNTNDDTSCDNTSCDKVNGIDDPDTTVELSNKEHVEEATCIESTESGSDTDPLLNTVPDTTNVQCNSNKKFTVNRVNNKMASLSETTDTAEKSDAHKLNSGIISQTHSAYQSETSQLQSDRHSVTVSYTGASSSEVSTVEHAMDLFVQHYINGVISDAVSVYKHELSGEANDSASSTNEGTSAPIRTSASDLSSSQNSGAINANACRHTLESDEITTSPVCDHSTANVISSEVDTQTTRSAVINAEDGLPSLDTAYVTNAVTEHHEVLERDVVQGLAGNKPQFHTSMSLNGMTQELASVLDDMNTSGAVMCHKIDTVEQIGSSGDDLGGVNTAPSTITTS